MNQFLGGLSQINFLKNHWDKKPFFIKNALSKLDLVSEEELFKYSTDESVESRIVKEHGGDYPWQAVYGPFDMNELNQLGNSHSTLLVQGVDRLSNKVSKLKDHINFIPSWKFDDIMVSYATNLGSVGAHFDRYNVFILQGKGKRLWKLQEKPNYDIIEDCDIVQLKEFKPDVEYTLEEGDMLFIPPLVAHHGVSIGESISYSLGFRSLDYSELVKGYCHSKIESYSSTKFFTDLSKEPANNNHTISSSDLEEIKSTILKEIVNEKDIQTWIKNYLSEPKFTPEINADDFFMQLKHHDLHVDPNTKCVVSTEGIHVNGTFYALNEEQIGILIKILEHHPTQKINYTELSYETLVAIEEMYQDGAFFLIVKK